MLPHTGYVFFHVTFEFMRVVCDAEGARCVASTRVRGAPRFAAVSGLNTTFCLVLQVCRCMCTRHARARAHVRMRVRVCMLVLLLFAAAPGDWICAQPRLEMRIHVYVPAACAHLQVILQIFFQAQHLPSTSPEHVTANFRVLAWLLLVLFGCYLALASSRSLYALYRRWNRTSRPAAPSAGSADDGIGEADVAAGCYQRFADATTTPR